MVGDQLKVIMGVRMTREPVEGDRVRNKQTGEYGYIEQVTDELYGFLVRPDVHDEEPYWEAVWNLIVIEDEE